MKPRDTRLCFRNWILLTIFIVWISQSCNGENIHHNLPDNLEIIDPKTLGLSGTDLEKFLGNVKLLPLEGEFGGDGYPKAQILTVGFNGDEKLNLQDFESLSTHGLPDSDKKVAEMAFKKFQNFFQNPQSAQDFDEVGNTSTEYLHSSTFATTTPSLSTSTARALDRGNPKHQKRIKIGKRPIFSSTFRSVPEDAVGDFRVGTTIRYSQGDLQNHGFQERPPTEVKQVHQGHNNHNFQQQMQHQGQHHQTHNHFQQTPLPNQQHRPQESRNNQNFQQHQQIPTQQHFPQQPPVHIYQHVKPKHQNFPKQKQLQQDNQHQIRHKNKNNQHNNENQYFLQHQTQENFPQHQNQNSHGHRQNQEHFALNQNQYNHQGHNQAPNPTQTQSGFTNTRIRILDKPVKNDIQETSSLRPQYNQYAEPQPPNHPSYSLQTSAQTYVQNGGQQFTQEPKRVVLKHADQNALRASVEPHKEHQFPYVPKQQHFTLQPPQNPRPFPAVQPYERYQTSTENNQHHFQTEIRGQHVVPIIPAQLQNGIQEINVNQNRQQKQIPQHPQGFSNEHDRENDILQPQQQQQYNAFQQEQQQQQNFELIQQHRIRNQHVPKDEPRQHFNPSQIDPLHYQHELNFASQSQSVQIPQAPNHHLQQYINPPQHHFTHPRFPPPPSTPQAVSMSGIFQITPSTPMIMLSTVENAMNAYKSNWERLQEMERIKHFDISQNQIPGSDQAYTNIKPQFQQPIQPHTNHQRFASQQKQPQNSRPQSPIRQHLNFQPPFPPPPPPNFKQDPIPTQTHNQQIHRPMPQFMHRPMNLPPQFRGPTQGRLKYARIPLSRFNNLQQQRFPPMIRGGRVLENQSRPPPPPHPIPIITAVHHNLNTIPPPPPPPLHAPRQIQNNYQQQSQNYPHELQLDLIPPMQNQLLPSNSQGSSRFISSSSHEEPHLHNEANTYTQNLGLNVQSINSAPLISSFRA